MDSVTPTSKPVDPQPEEKQTWTTPVLKKMDIEETAIGSAQNLDIDGAS